MIKLQISLINCWEGLSLFESQIFLLNLSMKCCNSAFNAQGLRVTTVVVQVGAMKICVAAVEALRKKERQDETLGLEKNIEMT